MGGSIFLSHISEDKELARVIKSWIEDSFLGQVSVFASTNEGDLRAGDEWFIVIKKAMDEASAVIVLCSNRSVHRSWINFEAGAGWAKGVPVISVCYSGMSKHLLPTPLNFFQGIDVAESGFGSSLFSSLASHLEYSRAPKIDHLAFEQQCLEAIGAEDLFAVDDDDISEWGIVDHQAALEDDFALFLSVIQDIGSETNDIGRIAKSFGTQITNARAKESHGTSRHVQKISKQLSKHFDSFTANLEKLNSDYASIASRLFASLDFVVKFDYTDSPEDVLSALATIHENLRTLIGAIISAKKGFSSLGDSMRTAPNLQRNLNKSLASSHHQVDAFVQNMNKTLEKTSAIVLAVEERLGS